MNGLISLFYVKHLTETKKKKVGKLTFWSWDLLTPLMLFWLISRLKKETLSVRCRQFYAKCWSHRGICSVKSLLFSLLSCSYNQTVQKVWFNLCMSRKKLACFTANLCVFCFWSCTGIGPVLSCLSLLCVYFPLLKEHLSFLLLYTLFHD